MNEEIKQVDEIKDAGKIDINLSDIVKYEKDDIVIQNDAERDEYIKILKMLAMKRKEVSEIIKPHKEKAYQLWNFFTKKEKEMISKIEVIEEKIRVEITRYEIQARKKLEEQRAKAIKEAEMKAEAERQALLKKAEQAKREDTREKYIAQAQAIVPIIPQDNVERKLDGISLVKVWKARVTDINQLPKEYIIPDMQKLNAIAKATKGTISIPGVEFYFEMSARIKNK